MRAPVWAHNTIALLMMMTIVTKLTMMLMTVHVMMPMINKYLNDDKVHSLAAMEAGIVTMALTNPLQVFCQHYQHQNGKTFGTSWWINRDKKKEPPQMNEWLRVLWTAAPQKYCPGAADKDGSLLTGDRNRHFQDYKRFFRMITRDYLGQMVHLTCELWMQNMT